VGGRAGVADPQPCWLAKAEATLALALACADAMGLTEHEPTIEYLVDLVVAPSDKDLVAPEVAAGLEESFGGGGYTALQRSALLQLASDHVASALDGRESAFELHANGGIPAWRGRLRRSFGRYNELANGILRALSLDMPVVDLDGPRAIPLAPRRQIAPPPPAAPTGRAAGSRGRGRAGAGLT
jgi:hypothetical protein